MSFIILTDISSVALSLLIDFKMLCQHSINLCKLIDKLHTTEAITHTRGGYANRHRGGAEVSICLYYSAWVYQRHRQATIA